MVGSKTINRFNGHGNIEVICVQPVADIIALSLQSAFVTNEANAFSLILIANAESAKTTLTHNFSSLDFVTYYDDVTQKRIIEDFAPKVRKGEKKILIIPDLINSVEKQKVTRAGFLNIIKSGTDDTGITEINTLHMKLERSEELIGVKFSVITAITQRAFISGNKIQPSLKRIMLDSGLLTRFIPFSYNYPPLIKSKIFSMLHGEPIEEKDIVKFPTINKDFTAIQDDSLLLRQLDITASDINNSMEQVGYGFRALTSLRRMAKANALLNNRTKIIQEDIDKVLYFSKWINFKCGDI